MQEDSSSTWMPVDEVSTAPVLETEHRAQAGRFYRCDSSRLSFTELWRDTRSPVVLLAWLTKLLRVKLPGSVNDPNVVSLLPFIIEDHLIEESVPFDVLRRFEPVLRELADLGFGSPVYFALEDHFHQSRTYQVAALHRDGRSIARLTHRVELQRKTHFFTEFISALTGGTFIWSSSARSQMLPPPQCRLNWNPRATASQLWVPHRQMLDGVRASGETVLTLHSREEMLNAVERHHEAVRDRHLERGIFSSMQGADLAQAEALDRNREEARAGRLRHPEVLAHLERLQSKRVSWTNALLVLAISIGAFMGMGAGASKWSWELLLMILGVLFVHEAGHWVAMKIFRYRNVRMFFIPFFGAAVSGEHYAAPGWKKVIVSFMGPLPGIAIGGIVGFAGIVKGSDLMVKVGMFAVILNLFQLLPVLPLDGGRVMHALLFSRHHALDAVFRVIAAAALMAIGHFSGDRILLYLGVFMLIGVPTAFKIAEMAGQLRRAGIGRATPAFAGPGSQELSVATQPVPSAAISPPEADAAEHAIPVPVAETIINRIRERFPRVRTDRQVAVLTQQAYELLVTRPPGVLASIAFAILHAGSFLVGLILLVALVVGNDPDLRRRILVEGQPPQRSVDPAAIVTWSGESSPLTAPQIAGTITSGESRSHDTIVATFVADADARRVFEDLKGRSPANAAMVLFGQSVLLSLPSSDEPLRTEHFAELEREAAEVFVESAGGFHAMIRLYCVLEPDAADALEEELDNYVEVPSALRLIPPWAGSDVDRRLPAERAAHEAARARYRKLQGAWCWDDPELKALGDEIQRAVRQGNQVEHRRLLDRQEALQNELRIRSLRAMTEEDPSNQALIEGYVSIERARQAARRTPASGEATTQAMNAATAPVDSHAEQDEWQRFLIRECKELGPLMGQLPLGPDGRRPLPGCDCYSRVYAYSDVLGSRRLSLTVTFVDVARGAPALVRWLAGRGASRFQYDFSSAGTAEGEWED